MSKLKFAYRAPLAGSAVLAALLAHGTAAAQDAAVTAAAADEEVIVVTAQRRTETLAEVPQSISVVNEETLERQQADSLADYVALVPGLNVTQSQPGQSRVILRGVNTGSSASTVAIYVDDTPFGSSASLSQGGSLAGDFDAFDVARIEVLKGPQGTLYGSNALGGVLRYITNAPDPGGFEARVRSSLETVDEAGLGYSANAMVNVPIGSNAAVRASGFYKHDPGFINATGRVANDIDDATVYGGRISLLAEPTDTLTVRLTALAQNVRANDASSFDVDPITLEPLTEDPFTGEPVEGRTQASLIAGEANADYRLYTGTLDWDVGFATLTSITSYGELNTTEISDQSLGVFSMLPLVTFLYGSEVPLGLMRDQVIDLNKISQEFRLASPDSDTVEWVVGAYYTDEKADLFQDFFPFEQGTSRVLDPALMGFPNLLTVELDSSYEEIAGFGNATWHVTPRWDVSAGARYSHNEQNSVQIQTGAFSALQGLPVPLVTSGASKENVFTWSLSTRYEVSDLTSVYARAAKGYRPGGPNVVPPGAPDNFPFQFDADTLVSYELGVRSETADRTFAIDASVFYLDWSNVLISTVFLSAVGPVGANDNGGGARSLGAEFSVTARPTDGLTLQANAAFTDAELTDDTPPATGGFDGDQLPFAPEFAATISADYEWAISGTATAFVGGDLRMVSEQAAGFEPEYRAAFGRRLEFEGYEVVDLRAGVDFGDYDVTLYARNLLNSHGLVSVGGFRSQFDQAVSATPVRPRTIGIAFTAGF